VKHFAPLSALLFSLFFVISCGIRITLKKISCFDKFYILVYTCIYVCVCIYVLSAGEHVGEENVERCFIELQRIKNISVRHEGKLVRSSYCLEKMRLDSNDRFG